MKFEEVRPNRAFEIAIEQKDNELKFIVCGSSETVEYLRESLEFESSDVSVLP